MKWKCSDFVLKMLEGGIYADITFGATDGGSVKAHRSVLTCVCPLLCEEVDEYDTKEHLKAPTQFGIIIMSIDALKPFLILLYTTNADDAVEVPQLRCAIDKHFKELYKAVSEYNVEKRLRLVLLPALARQLTPDNCWYYYESSLTAEHVPYKISSSETCYNYILGNYAEVILSESFLEQMKKNHMQVHRIMVHAEYQDARQEALRSFQAVCNSNIQAEKL